MTGRIYGPWLWCFALIACGANEDAARQARAPAKLQVAERAKAAPLPFVGPRVTERAGVVHWTPEGTPAENLAPDTELTLESDASLVLDFQSGARVSLFGPAHVWVGVRQKHGLLVRAGLVSVDYPQSGGAEQLWLGTTAGRFLVLAGTRAALSLGADRTAAAAVAAGMVKWDDGVIAGGDIKSDTQALTSGETLLVFPTREAKQQSSIRTLDQALKSVREVAREGEANEDVQKAITSALEITLAALNGHDRDGQMLLDEHARLVAAKDPRAKDVQRRIAVHAAQSFRLHEAMDVQWGRAQAAGVLPAHAELSRRIGQALER